MSEQRDPIQHAGKMLGDIAELLAENIAGADSTAVRKEVVDAFFAAVACPWDKPAEAVPDAPKQEPAKQPFPADVAAVLAPAEDDDFGIPF